MNLINQYLIIIKSYVGFLVDIYRILNFKIINPHSFTKYKIINELRKKTGASTFIESGTYFGVTAYRASFLFDKVYTIELDKSLAEEAKKLLESKKM